VSNAALLWTLTLVLCGAFIMLSFRFKKQANTSFSHYAIGDGHAFPFVLLFFTYFSTIMGAGNFFGHAGNAYEIGLPWMAYILGEQGAKLLFALVFAGAAGAFTYKTLPEMLDDIVVKDKVSRVLAALLLIILLVAMIGGQSKALGSIFAEFTGMDPIPIQIIFSAVFILFTCLGGIYSVVWLDLVQGILCCVFAVIFYLFAFSKVDFSFAVLGERLAAVGREQLWSFSNVNGLDTFNKFFTGLIGILVSQVIWQRCFCSKTGKEARNSLFLSGIICIVFTMATAFVGLIIVTLNPNLDANTAMSWFMTHAMPRALAAVIFLLILCAGMSTADSALNSCAVVIVNDILHPLMPGLNDRQLLAAAKVCTVLVGTASCLAGIFSHSIYSLIAGSNTLAASALAPIVLIGLAWKRRRGAHEMGTCNSRVAPWGARASMVIGFLAALFPIFKNAVSLWAVFLGSAALVLVSLVTGNRSEKT